MSTPFHERHWRNLRQFIRFGIVGGSGLVVNMLVAVLLHKLHGGTAYADAKLFAIPGTPFNVRYRHFVWVMCFLVANLTNFQLNRSWTFKSSGHAKWSKEFWPFLAVGSVAAALGLLIITGFTHKGSPLYLPDPPFNENQGFTSREYWAQLFTIIITMPINFVVNKLWTFRAVRQGRRPTVPVPDDTTAQDTTAQDTTAQNTSTTEPPVTTPASTADPGH